MGNIFSSKSFMSRYFSGPPKSGGPAKTSKFKVAEQPGAAGHKVKGNAPFSKGPDGPPKPKPTKEKRDKAKEVEVFIEVLKKRFGFVRSMSLCHFNNGVCAHRKACIL